MLEMRCSVVRPQVFTGSHTHRRRILTNMSYLCNVQTMMIKSRPSCNRSIHASKTERIISSSTNIASQGVPLRTTRKLLSKDSVERVFSYIHTSELIRLVRSLSANKPDRLLCVLKKTLLIRLASADLSAVKNNIKIFAVNTIPTQRKSVAPLNDVNCSQIMLDSSRTFRQPESQCHLTKLLKRICTELHCEYVQGMNAIAANCLRLTSDQDEAYTLCYFIFQEQRYAKMLSNGLAKIEQMNAEIDRRVRIDIPRLWNGLAREDLNVSLLTTKWLITLFSEDFSPQTTARLWLLFFLKGQQLLVDAAIIMLEVLFRRFELERLTDLGVFVSDFKRKIFPADEAQLFKALNADSPRSFKQISCARRQGIKVTSSVRLR